MASRADRSPTAVVERLAQPCEFLRAADERRRRIVVVDLAVVDLVVGDPERGHRFVLALDRDLAEHLVPDVRPGQPPGVLAHEHLSRGARRFEPSGGVDRVTDQIGVAVGEHDLTGVDPDP